VAAVRARREERFAVDFGFAFDFGMVVSVECVSFAPPRLAQIIVCPRVTPWAASFRRGAAALGPIYS